MFCVTSYTHLPCTCMQCVARCTDKRIACIGSLQGSPKYTLQYSASPFIFAVSRSDGSTTTALFNTAGSRLVFKVPALSGSDPWQSASSGAFINSGCKLTCPDKETPGGAGSVFRNLIKNPLHDNALRPRRTGQQHRPAFEERWTAIHAVDARSAD